jgi:hypothetical protein
MKTIIADTYYFLAVGSELDQGHQRAVQYAASYTGRLVTSEWVLTEVGDALASPAQRERFLELLALIHDDEKWVVIEGSHSHRQRAIFH